MEGDAEALPIDDEGVDVVISTFGAMLAPRHDVAARELARVLRPGAPLRAVQLDTGRLGGRSSGPVGALRPPPPPFVAPPPLEGEKDFVRKHFDAIGIDLEFDQNVVDLGLGSAADGAAFYTATFGPLVPGGGETSYT